MANRTKSEFLATMSHELRTPLNAIIGFAQIMSMEAFGPLGNGRYRDYAADIGDSGTHLLEIINDILDIAKMEAGKLEIADEVVDVGATVAAACRLIRARAEKARLTLAVAVPAELPPLRADARQLKQMLINLLTNAVKFTPDGGRVEVRAAVEPQGGLGIAVADTGIGIAPAHLSRVVEPFFQVDSSLSRRHEGTGLGLTLVAAMIREHGGAFHLESDLGKGTTATISFPRERLLPLTALAQAATRAADMI
jgi:signal transduction histidine kinase